MRMILTLAAVAMLAGCTQGNWNSKNSMMSFSFDTGFISRAFSHNGGSKAMPPSTPRSQGVRQPLLFRTHDQ